MHKKIIIRGTDRYLLLLAIVIAALCTPIRPLATYPRLITIASSNIFLHAAIARKTSQYAKKCGSSEIHNQTDTFWGQHPVLQCGAGAAYAGVYCGILRLYRGHSNITMPGIEALCKPLPNIIKSFLVWRIVSYNLQFIMQAGGLSDMLALNRSNESIENIPFLLGKHTAYGIISAINIMMYYKNANRFYTLTHYACAIYSFSKALNHFNTMNRRIALDELEHDWNFIYVKKEDEDPREDMMSVKNHLLNHRNIAQSKYINLWERITPPQDIINSVHTPPIVSRYCKLGFTLIG